MLRMSLAGKNYYDQENELPPLASMTVKKVEHFFVTFNKESKKLACPGKGMDSLVLFL
jgi:hypothetical protein